MKVKILRTEKIAFDGINISSFEKGEIVDLPMNKGTQLIHYKIGEEVIENKVEKIVEEISKEEEIQHEAQEKSPVIKNKALQPVNENKIIKKKVIKKNSKKRLKKL